MPDGSYTRQREPDTRFARGAANCLQFNFPKENYFLALPGSVLT